MTVLLQNKKARFDYEILEKFEAGMSLLGFEVKALRNKQGSLLGSRVIIRGGEAFVIGMSIPPYQSSNTQNNYDPQRTRKLLLKKNEIKYLLGKSGQRGIIMVPTSVYAGKRVIKMGIAIARGKKKYDKREIIKKRDSKKKIERELKHG